MARAPGRQAFTAGSDQAACADWPVPLSEALREKTKRDAIMVRGVILNHYAAVEFAVDELLYRCRRTVAYRELIPLKLPRPVDEKLALMGTVLSLPGPLAPHAAKLVEALAHLNDFTKYRHLAAHGRLVLEFPATGPKMLLEKFRVTGGSLGADWVRLDGKDVEHFTQQFAGYASAVLSFLEEASADAGLPTLDEPDDDPTQPQ